MSYRESINTHYGKPDLTARILDHLQRQGIELEHLKWEDLIDFDQFHGGGMKSTLWLAEATGLGPGMRVLDVGAGIEGVGEILDIVGVVGQARIGCGFARRHFGIRLHPGQGGRQLARVWAHGDRADGECRELRGVHGVNALYRGHHLHEYAVWHHAQFVLELADRVLHGGTQRVLADFAITARLCPWPLAQQQIRRCRGAIEAWHLVDVAFP